MDVFIPLAFGTYYYIFYFGTVSVFLKGDLVSKQQLLLKMMLFHHKTKWNQNKLPGYM